MRAVATNREVLQPTDRALVRPQQFSDFRRHRDVRRLEHLVPIDGLRRHRCTCRFRSRLLVSEFGDHDFADLLAMDKEPEELGGEKTHRLPGPANFREVLGDIFPAQLPTNVDAVPFVPVVDVLRHHFQDDDSRTNAFAEQLMEHVLGRDGVPGRHRGIEDAVGWRRTVRAVAGAGNQFRQRRWRCQTANCPGRQPPARGVGAGGSSRPRRWGSGPTASGSPAAAHRRAASTRTG